MYDWPEERAHVDALWTALRDELRAAGVDAPDTLTRPADLTQAWLSPRLLVGQTCSYPLETVLAGRVRYVATPVVSAPGCERPGFYRSALVMRGGAPSMPVPDAPGPALPAIEPAMRLAFNSHDSMSGFHALLRDTRAAACAMPQAALETGSHRASIRAVAEGAADIAAIDCVSWQLALRHEPAAAALHLAGWTGERPALPLITALSTPEHVVAALKTVSRKVMGAVVLQRPIDA